MSTINTFPRIGLTYNICKLGVRYNAFPDRTQDTQGPASIERIGTDPGKGGFCLAVISRLFSLTKKLEHRRGGKQRLRLKT